jgi:hypothetical protein
MNSDDRTSLEQELHALGTQELQLENVLQDLRLRSRHAGLAGQHDIADQAWTLFEKFRSELSHLQIKIRTLEAKVYSRKQQEQK